MSDNVCVPIDRKTSRRWLVTSNNNDNNNSPDNDANATTKLKQKAENAKIVINKVRKMVD